MNIIEEARLKKYINQAELARRTNFSRSYISKLESNKKLPSPEAINVLSHSLEICPVAIYIHFYLNDKFEYKCFKNKDVICCDFKCSKKDQDK